jgi:hypothetical protein
VPLGQKTADPKGEYLMMKGNDIYLKKTGKKQVHRKVKDAEGESGLSMLLDLFRTGGRRFNDEFEVQMKPDAGDLLVTLRQDDPDQDMLPLKIENRISRADMGIKSVLVRFKENQTILYEFIKPIRNKAILPSVFENPERP